MVCLGNEHRSICHFRDCIQALYFGLFQTPHVRGQGQKLGGPYARGAAANRSYPESEVRGSGRQCQVATVQKWPRGATPRSRSEAAAKRSYPASEARGGSWEEQAQVQGAMAVQAQEGLEELSMFQVRRGGSEEIPLVQGKEQPLRFAGAAVKRYPTSRVRETQVMW